MVRKTFLVIFILRFFFCFNSRYGYKNLDEVKSVVAKYKSANIPLETMWNDIGISNNFK